MLLCEAMALLTEENRCPDCQAWHGIPPLEHLEPGVPCGHDKNYPCNLCGEPVGGLSTGGPGICCGCEVDPERPEKIKLERYQRELAYNPEIGNNLWCCVTCRHQFNTIPYICCPYTARWICGCENIYRSDDEMLRVRIFLTEKEVYGRKE